MCFLHTVQSSGVTVLQVTNCTSQWNGERFSYTVEWTIPDLIAFGDGFIDSFNLGANLLHKGNIQSAFESSVVHKQVNQTKYRYTWTNFSPKISDYTYRFSVSYEGVLIGNELS